MRSNDGVGSDAEARETLSLLVIKTFPMTFLELE